MNRGGVGKPEYARSSLNASNNSRPICFPFPFTNHHHHFHTNSTTDMGHCTGCEQLLTRNSLHPGTPARSWCWQRRGYSCLCGCAVGASRRGRDVWQHVFCLAKGSCIWLRHQEGGFGFRDRLLVALSLIILVCLLLFLLLLHSSPLLSFFSPSPLLLRLFNIRCVLVSILHFEFATTRSDFLSSIYCACYSPMSTVAILC